MKPETELIKNKGRIDMNEINRNCRSKNWNNSNLADELNRILNTAEQRNKKIRWQKKNKEKHRCMTRDVGWIGDYSCDEHGSTGIKLSRTATYRMQQRIASGRTQSAPNTLAIFYFLK